MITTKVSMQCRLLSGLLLGVLLMPMSAWALDRGKQVTLSQKDAAERMMATLEDAVWAADGQAADKQVYVVYNTDCAWSKRFYEESRALAGKLQLRWIAATGNAAPDVVTSRNAGAVGRSFAGAGARVEDMARARRAIAYNHGVQVSIDHQLRGQDNSRTFAYPTLVYRTARGTKVVAGNPANLAALAGEVLAQPAKAGHVPAGIALTAQPVRVVSSRNLPKWNNDGASAAVIHALPSLQSPPIHKLEPNYLLPVRGVVEGSEWLELDVWGDGTPGGYVHDPLMARLAQLDFRVKPVADIYQSAGQNPARSFPDAQAPVLEMLKPGERVRRVGVVELGGRTWDKVVLYADGSGGYVLR
ncbi:MAG: hypothetical protein WA956_02550 [Stenotrophomonas sp.]